MYLRITFVFLFICQVLSAQMVTSGSTTGDCDCFELTDAAAQGGSVWSPTTIDLSNPFDFTFEVNLGADDVWGADGMTFSMRQAGTGTGTLGYGLGYEGILNSIAVEIDTWNSSPTVASDISDDHIGMSSGGDVEHNLEGPFAIANIEDDTYHLLNITWDPVTLDFVVSLDGTIIFTHTEDLVAAHFGGVPDVFFGMTGGTGGVFNTQTVCMYRTADFSADLETVCVGQPVEFTDLSSSELNYDDIEIISYSWDFDDLTTSIEQNPIHVFDAVGIYTVELTVTDISGCESTATLDIEVLDPLDIDITKTDVTCFGDDDGTALADPLTGLGPYSYVWDTPLADITADITDLPPNTYTVEVLDATGCPGSATVTIVEPDLLEITDVTTTNASCGMSNGSMTITVSGGTLPYSYSIDNGVTFQADNEFTDLLNGTYRIVVTDGNGCEVRTDGIVRLDSPFRFIGVVVTAESCVPANDGSILIRIRDGVGPFEYSIDGGVTTQASNFFDFLPGDVYDIVVTDDVGCRIFAEVEVEDLSDVEIDAITATDLSCFNDASGAIEVFASGGLAPYSYSIDGGAAFGPTNSFPDLASGTYDIVIFDADGCSADSTVVLTEPTPLVIDPFSVTQVTCFGDLDGQIELTGSGGVGTIEYSVNAGMDFQLSGVFTDLSPGLYPTQIRDDNLCIEELALIVVEPDLLEIDNVVITDVSCNGFSDGEIEIEAIGGTGTYTYSLEGGPFQLSPVFDGLTSDNYTIVVKDENDCEATMEVEIMEPTLLNMTLGLDTTICLGGMANLCPTVTGGTMPYSYEWDGRVAVDACLITDVIGVHRLQVIDANTCVSSIEEVDVAQYTPLSVITGPDRSICPGDEVNLFGEAVGGGPNPITYSWSNNLDATTLIGPVHTLNPMLTITYTLEVSTGCENTASSTTKFTMYPIPVVSIVADKYEGCEDLTVTFSNLTEPALMANTAWTIGDGTTGIGTNFTTTFTEPDCYDVAVDITTVNGCKLDASYTDLVCVWEMPKADFDFNPEEPNLFNREVEFENLSEGATSYIWTFGDRAGSLLENPSHEYLEVGNANYNIRLIAISDFGCEDTITKPILLEEVLQFYIPNAFTPDGNGFNSEFKPVVLPGFYPNDYKLQIFNRWGELLFVSYDYNYGWNGTYDGVIAQDDVYIWEITFRENKTDKKHQKIGHFTLLK